MVVNAYAGRYLIEIAAGWPLKQWRIVSNTATAFTLDGGGAPPAAGDYAVTAGATHGSTHAIYYFAGRSRILISGCVFRGVRTTGAKVSGSALPIHDVEITGCVFDECGAGIIAGADDAQEHSNFNFHHNRFVNCGNGRAGWQINGHSECLGPVTSRSLTTNFMPPTTPSQRSSTAGRSAATTASSSGAYCRRQSADGGCDDQPKYVLHRWH